MIEVLRFRRTGTLPAVAMIVAAIAIGIAVRQAPDRTNLDGFVPTPRPSPEAAFATDAPRATPLATHAPAASVAPGCGPSDLGVAFDRNPPAPDPRALGFVEVRLAAGAVVADDFADLGGLGYIPLRPSEPPGRPLQVILLYVDAQVLLIYSVAKLAETDTARTVLIKTGYLLNQAPFQGRDAELVMSVAPSDDYLVQVGPHPAALVIGTPLGEGISSVGLYWADGPRQWMLRGDPERLEDLVDLARSIYC